MSSHRNIVMVTKEEDFISQADHHLYLANGSVQSKNNFKMKYQSEDKIYLIHRKTNVKKWFWISMAVLFWGYFTWTQNISLIGNVSSLYQEQRPQQLNSPIPGKIVKWFVKMVIL